MSTHIDGLHTTYTRIALSTNSDLAEQYPEIEESGDERVLGLEAPGNCHLVVVEGDLETFARDVWCAVFEQTPAHPSEPSSTRPPEVHDSAPSPATLQHDDRDVEVGLWPAHPDMAADGGPDAIVVQIDTGSATGRLRVNVNDAPIWDGDPSTDQCPGAWFDTHPES